MHKKIDWENGSFCFLEKRIRYWDKIAYLKCVLSAGWILAVGWWILGGWDPLEDLLAVEPGVHVHGVQLIVAAVQPLIQGLPGLLVGENRHSNIKTNRHTNLGKQKTLNNYHGKWQLRMLGRHLQADSYNMYKTTSQKDVWKRSYVHILVLLNVDRLKGTQDWEFFWLRIWILYYFIVSTA